MPSRCAAAINHLLRISSDHSRSIYHTFTSFLQHRESSPIKPQSKPRCSTSPSPSLPSPLEPLLLPRRDRPPMPTRKTHKYNLLLFLMLTYAVPPSTRSSRLPSPAPFWLSTLPTLPVSPLRSHPSWPPVRPPPGSLLFLRMFSHTFSTPLPPVRSSPMPPLQLLVLPLPHLLLL